MSTLCSLFGRSRQAYYQWRKSEETELLQEHILLERIIPIRKQMKRISGRKIHHLLKKNHIHIGRDKLYEIMRKNGLLVRLRKRRKITTQSNHWLFKYNNLILDFIPNAPHQLWVSDITYIPGHEQDYYLYLITDAYSRRIIGNYLAKDLRAINAVNALCKALSQLPIGEYPIHHSDRGVQYCSTEYVNILKKSNISISMSAAGEVLENALAERVNGILKNEWIYDDHYTSYKQACSRVEAIIKLYNDQRPHLSLNMLTPSEAHNKRGSIKKLWKNYYKKPLNY